MPSKARQGDKSAKLTPLQLRRKIALLEKGLSVADIARKANVSRQTAWEVLMDRCTSQRVQGVYAELTGKPMEYLFPKAA
jgi:lambda repressor-like predicted transcriptional regulator